MASEDRRQGICGAAKSEKRESGNIKNAFDISTFWSYHYYVRKYNRKYRGNTGRTSIMSGNMAGILVGPVFRPGISPEYWRPGIRPIYRAEIWAGSRFAACFLKFFWRHSPYYCLRPADRIIDGCGLIPPKG